MCTSPFLIKLRQRPSPNFQHQKLTLFFYFLSIQKRATTGLAPWLQFNQAATSETATLTTAGGDCKYATSIAAAHDDCQRSSARDEGKGAKRKIRDGAGNVVMAGLQKIRTQMIPLASFET
jgi:hypothetical protein